MGTQSIAICALQNYLRDKNMNLDGEEDSESESDDDVNYTVPNVTHTSRTTGASYNTASKHLRDVLAEYFVGSGRIRWQWKHAKIHVNT